MKLVKRVSSPVLSPPTQNLTVVKYAEGFGYSAVEWEGALSAINWKRDAEPLKDGRTGSVWRARVTIGGRELDCVLKLQPLPSVWMRLKALIRQTKAWRQWRGADLASSRGVAVARCLVVLRTAGIELLVLEHVDGPTLLEWIAPGNATISQERGIAAALAAQFALFYREPSANAIYNGDHKPSNLVVTGPPGRPVLVLLDSVAIREVGPDLQTMEDMLFALYIEPLGVGCPPRKSLCMRVLRSVYAVVGAPADDQAWRTWRGDIWQRVARRVRDHGDPTPEDNPLRRPEHSQQS